MGAQTRTFQGRRSFSELGQFNKRFTFDKQKEDRCNGEL